MKQTVSLKKNILDLCIRLFGYPLYRLWFASLRLKSEQKAGNLPAIVAFFHQDIFTAIGWMARYHKGYYALVSPSRDGDYLSIILRLLGFGLIRGSSETEPVHGMWKSLQILREGNGLLIAPDGPRGPAGKVKDGVLHLAAICGAPIYVLTISYRRYRRLKSWDRFVLPLPFSRCELKLSEPMFICNARDRETTRLTMEKKFHAD